jgi:hypothetical protein
VCVCVCVCACVCVCVRACVRVMWGTRYAIEYLVEALCYAGSIPDVIEFFFNLPNPSSRTMALVFTQPDTEISTRSLSGGGNKARPARKAHSLTTICEPIA